MCTELHCTALSFIFPAHTTGWANNTVDLRCVVATVE